MSPGGDFEHPRLDLATLTVFIALATMIASTPHALGVLGVVLASWLIWGEIDHRFFRRPPSGPATS